MEEQEARLRGRSKREIVIEEFTPYIICVLSNVSFAGFNIISKISLDKGMSCYVLVAYGHAFATLVTAIPAFLFERNNESRISIPVLRNIFFMGLLGGALGRTLFYLGLENTSPIFASATANTVPSITFILAVLCRMERVNISKLSAQAKIGGTIIAFAGAIVMTLFKGMAVLSTHKHSRRSASSVISSDKDWIKGCLMLFGSFVSMSSFFILQTTTVKMYPAPLTLTSLTCLSATLLSTIMSAILDHKAASWRLSWNITLLAPLYSGIVVFGIVLYAQTLVMRRKGPVFVTAFRPLATVVATVMAILILGDALHLGSIMGSVLIFVGLYAILWGKNKEMETSLSKHAISDQQVVEIKPEK
ncbi:hypothetical protein UlMin_014010 [Ulmus minor]